MNSKIAKLLLPTVAGTVVGFSTILALFGTAFATESVIISSPVKQAISNVVLYLQDSSGNFIKVKVDNFDGVAGETKTYDPTSVLQKYPNYTLAAYTVKAGNNKESGMGSGEGELVIVGSGIQQSQLPTYNTSDANTYQYKAVYSTTTVSSSTTNTNTTSTSTVSSSTTNTNTTSTSPVSSSGTTTSNTSNSNDSTSTPTVSSETSGSTQPSTVNESTVVSSETSGSTQPSTVNESTVVSSETSGSTQPSTVNESTVVSSETSGETQSAPVAQSPVISSHNTQTTKPVSVPEPSTITAIALFGLGGLFTKKKLKSSSK
jgi:hypothetical protein